MHPHSEIGRQRGRNGQQFLFADRLSGRQALPAAAGAACRLPATAVGAAPQPARPASPGAPLAPPAPPVARECRGSESRSSGLHLAIVVALALQRHQAVLLGRAQFPLGVQILERLRHVAAGQRRLDHRVHQPPAGGHVRIGKRFAVALDQLLALGRPCPRLPEFPCGTRSPPRPPRPSPPLPRWARRTRGPRPGPCRTSPGTRRHSTCAESP